MAIRNDAPWDPSFVDPTDRPADGLIARFVGGRSGPMSFENGAAVSFPWKRQQEITGTYPGTIRVHDDVDKELMEVTGPTILAAGNRARVYLAGWSDGTSSIGLLAGGASLLVASGQVYVEDGPFTAPDIIITESLTVGTDLAVTGDIGAGGQVSGSTVTTGGATLGSSGTGTFNGLIEGNAGIDVAGGPVSLASNNDVLIAAADDVTIQGGGAAGTVAIVATGTGTSGLLSDASAGVTYVQGGAVNVVAQAGALAMSGTTGVNMNTGSSTSVRANSYPIAPIRDRDGALWGTPPAVSATTTGYRWQGGTTTVSFTAGSGLLNFLSAFGIGLVSITVNAHTNDTVITLDPTTGVNDAAIWLRAYTAGVAVTANVTLSYIALGWG